MFPIMYLRRFAKAITPSAAIRRRRPIHRDWGISPPACRSNFREAEAHRSLARAPNAAVDKTAGHCRARRTAKIEVVTIVISHCVVKLLQINAAADIDVGVDDTSCVYLSDACTAEDK
jgi:hypothetical protein